MEALQKHPSFKKIQMALERKRLAPVTAEGYVNSVFTFVEQLNLGDPEKALETIKQKEDPEQYLNDTIDTLSEKLTDSRIYSIFKGLRYWLRVNGAQIDWDSVIVPTGEAKVEDRIPKKEELKRLLAIANIRDKAVTLFASTSGLRLQTILTLSVGDVKFDMPNGIARIMVKRIYKMKGKVYRTGRKISKRRKFFVTFITPEAAKALKDYLEWRKERGEVLTDESPLFTKMSRSGQGEFLNKNAFDNQWHKLLKRGHLAKKAPGSPWTTLHFHVLKKYADTKMIDAGVKKAYREFFLGHRGAYLEVNYFRGEEEKCIEEYGRAIRNLSVTEVARISEKQRRIRTILDNVDMLVATGQIREEKAKQIRSTIMMRTRKHLEVSMKEIMEMIRESETKEDPNDCANGEHCPTFKEIGENELLAHLNHGWKIVHNLQNGKLIIRKG